MRKKNKIFGLAAHDLKPRHPEYEALVISDLPLPTVVPQLMSRHLTVTASITPDSICPGCYTLRGEHNFSRRWSRNCHPARTSVTRHTCVLPVSPLLFKIAYFSMCISFLNSNYNFPVGAMFKIAHSNAFYRRIFDHAFTWYSSTPATNWSLSLTVLQLALAGVKLRTSRIS